MGTDNYIFLLGRKPDNDLVNMWRMDIDDPQLLVPVDNHAPIAINPKNRLTPAGNYLLEWGPGKKPHSLKYALHEFNPATGNPLGDAPVQKGSWNSKWKFFHGHLDFGHFGNKHKDGPDDRNMEFVPFGNYIMAWVAEPARGNFRLWNFDPGSKDPLQRDLHPAGAWGTIQQGTRLISMGNTAISWVPKKHSSTYRLWSFDPGERKPLKEPVLQKGKWPDIDETHQLMALGDYILDWIPANGDYRLWKFDPSSPGLLGKKPVRTGTLPKLITADMTLTGIVPNQPIDQANAKIPGTTDHMRKKIKHVVYYMIENRSFDHVCGWLYNESELPAQIIGPQGAFKAARKSDFNVDAKGKKVPISVYQGGKLSKSYDLELLPSDPHHDHSDVMRQMFHPQEKGYKKRKTPNMEGFVINNALHQVMETYSPEQLPVLNGLAKSFAISDEWFCSMPGGTDVNRAFSLTGSSYAMLDNFQNGEEYHNWANVLHRPSIWKTLWSNGITDWKIYNSIEWYGYVFSYHLFLEGQVPSIDAEFAKGAKTGKPSRFGASIDQFIKDAKKGNLPAFSFIEPVWVAPTGTTSYHPGHDLIPGEEKLNELFNAIQDGPGWDETLLVITFDEHGGIYDHVPPPYAKNPWPNDDSNGFKFDIMGVRVPTILVSPMINEKTVFRADGNTAYDSTSILATLLNWFGIPKSRWGLGDRTNAAPTFENVINREKPRTGKLEFKVPYDKSYPVPPGKIPLHDLHRQTAHRLLITLGKDMLNVKELIAKAEDISGNSKTLKELHQRISEFAASVSKLAKKKSGKK